MLPGKWSQAVNETSAGEDNSRGNGKYFGLKVSKINSEVATTTEEKKHPLQPSGLMLSSKMQGTHRPFPSTPKQTGTRCPADCLHTRGQNAPRSGGAGEGVCAQPGPGTLLVWEK